MDDAALQAPPSGGPDYFAVPDLADVAYAPAAGPDTPDPGWWARTGNAWMLGPSVQAMARMAEWLQPSDRAFDPLTQPELAEFPEWTPWLREARSKPEFDMMLARYRENQGRQQVNALHGTIWNELAAGVMAPENFLIPEVSMGRSLLSGAARGAAYGAATALPLIAVNNALDPTHAPGHELEELFYASVAGGLFGGAVGGLTGASDALHARVGGFARQLSRETRDLDARLDPVVGPDGAARAADPALVAARQEAESLREQLRDADPAADLVDLNARLAEAETRVADLSVAPRAAPDAPRYRADPTPAGAERGDIALPDWLAAVVSKGGVANPLATAWGGLAGSAYRGLQDFAHMMGGDFSLVTKRNRAGQATPVSAWLLAGRWNALAAETERLLQRAYAGYLGKPDSAEAVGLNLTTTGARLGGLLRRATKRVRADGRLEYHEWLEAIFDAHKPDKLEADLSRYVDQSEAAKHSVLEGAAIVRDFFDQADREGTALDFLPSKAGFERTLKRRFDALDASLAALDQLEAIPDKTPQQQAELILLYEKAERQSKRIPDWAHKQRAYDRLIDEWRERRAEGESFADLVDLHLRLRALELDGVGQRKKRDAAARGADTTPRTDHVPPEAANAPLAPANDDLAAELPGASPEEIAFVARVYGSDAPQPMPSANEARAYTPEYRVEPPKKLTDEEMLAKAHEIRAEQERAYHEDRLPLANTIDEITNAQIADYLDPYQSVPDDELHANVLEVRALAGSEGEKDWLARYNNFRRAVDGGAMAPQEIPDILADLVAEHASTPYVVRDKDGKPVAQLRLSVRPEGHYEKIDPASGEVTVGQTGQPLLWVEFIETTDAAGRGQGYSHVGTLGPKFIRDLGYQLREHFPQVEEVGGFRVSGARGEANTPASVTMRLPDFRGRPKVEGGGEPFAPHRMAGPANDNAHVAAEDLAAHPVESRNAEGMLPDHERLTAANINDELGGPDTDPFYLTRRWDNERVRTDPDGLRAAFDRWHQDQGKARLDDDQWRSILDGILAGPEAGQERFADGPVGGVFRLGRKLDIPNAYVRDFVERNVSNLVREYSHRFGTGLEVHRMFGDRDAEDAIADALIQMVREHQGGSVDGILKDAERYRGQARYLRDQVLGDLHVQDPLTMGKVAAETLKSWTSTIALGKVIFSTLPELARPLMTHGFLRNFQFMTDNLIGNLGGFQEASRDLRLRVGEAIDVAMGLSGRRLMEFGDLNRPGSTLAHRTRAALDPFLSFANGPWYIMNLLGPVTDLTKNYVMTMSSHYLIDDMRRLVAGRASEKTVQNLLALGIDHDGAEAMLGQAIERSGRLNVANLAGWQDQVLANRYAAAIRGDVNRVIATASPQSKSALSQGFLQYDSGRRQWAMVTLPFQFMHWGLSAVQKVSLSALQGRDANALAGTASLIGMAYLANWLRTDDRQWQKTPLEERVFRAVDNSGALAVLGNLNQLVETGSRGAYGMRPAFGIEPPFERSQAGLAGPGIGSIADLYRSFTDPKVDDYGRASAVRRAIPTNGLVYTDWLWKGAQRTLMEPDEYWRP